MAGRDKQSGTLETTLDRHYVQDDLEPKIELARRMAERIGKKGATVPTAVLGPSDENVLEA